MEPLTPVRVWAGLYLFQKSNFVSTAFYPAAGAPEPLATAFYLNPLTYLVDIIRAGIFGTITEFIILEMIVLAVLAAILFIIATKLLTKLDF